MEAAISCSGGKDSVASMILCHEYAGKVPGIPELKAAVFSDIYFDRKAGTSCTNPLHLQFIKEKLIPAAESWGIDFRILRAEKDFLSVFNHRIERASKYPEHNGLRYGFVLPGTRCALKRDCKLPPIRKYYREIGENGFLNVVGIAADETRRLASMHLDSRSISVLEILGITEREAYEICKEHGLLSPVYSVRNPDTGRKQWRDGCWCCPYAKESEHLLVKKLLPETWEQYVALEQYEDVAYDKWNVYSDETLHERDKRLDEMIRHGF